MTRARALGKMCGLSLAACLLPACKDDVHVREVTLAFSERENTSAPDAGSLSGFTCAEQQELDAAVPEYLVRRALSPVKAGVRKLEATMVIQAFALKDNPGCRDTKLYNYCGPGDGNCMLVPESTLCVELAGAELNTAAVSHINRVHAALAEMVEDPDAGLARTPYDRAPLDRWVLLRAVGTTETCEEVMAAGHVFDPERLIGCAFTCPVVLSDWSGKLWFDSAASGRCETSVISCAGETFSPSPYEVASPAD